MIYKNNTSEAVNACEYARTGNYGNDSDHEDEEIKTCPLCGDKNPEEFYLAQGVCIGCSECVKRVEWEEYDGKF